MTIDVFAQHFADVKDPRQTAKVSYPLYDVLFLSICAIITGCEGWEDIEDFGKARLVWLQGLGLFKEGLPVHDTIARLISRIDPSALQSSFIRWMQEVVKLSEGEVVAVDGKCLRSSYNRHDRQSAIHMVSAFATTNGVVIGQKKTDIKSNEITAIPDLLNLLEIKGCLITIDAMGCQHKITQTIVDKGADYLIAVKGNQQRLYDSIKQAFASVNKATRLHIEKGHGRVEAREYHVLDASDIAKSYPDWAGLKSIGMAINYQHNGRKESLEYRYYISSALLTTEQFGKAARGHWGIESKLHWVLDTAMREDNCQIYRGDGAENIARLRHIGVNLIKTDTSRKASVRRKQRMAAMDTSYLEAIFLAACTSIE
jgi:predicted transposase YbfD/YdcC